MYACMYMSGLHLKIIGGGGGGGGISVYNWGGGEHALPPLNEALHVYIHNNYAQSALTV